MCRARRLSNVEDMTVTAPVPLATGTTRRVRELPPWVAGMLAILGNIVVVAIFGLAVAATAAAAAVVFGASLFEQF